MTERAYDKNTAWTQTVLPPMAPLARDHTADVCVVGAGIAGLSTAYFLAKAGKSVVVLDNGSVGGGESGLTTAHITNALDRRWASLAKLHGVTALRAAARSHTSAIETVERIVREEEIDCDFERVHGYLFAAPGTLTTALREEIEAAHRAGLGSVHYVDRAPLLDFDTGPAVRFPDQAQFHIRRYLAGLSRAIERDGGNLYTLAHVIDVEERAVPDKVVVKTARGHAVVASEVVLATNSPFIPRISLHMKQAAYRTYVIGLRIPRGAVPPGLYWDTADPFHYVRLASLDGADGPDEILLVGGEDHKTGQASDADRRHARLEAWARARFTQAGEVLHRWSGEVMETVDGLAYIGRIKEGSRILIATGDCGNGMTHGTIAGLVISDLVQGRESRMTSLYAPTRVNLRPPAIAELVRENANVACQYASWLGKGDVEDAARIPPGSGAVVRRGLKKLAVYRDPQGQLHEMSAMCTHLGGIVSWNPAERSWDCRCHGARYEATGRVIRGPATADLAKVAPAEAPAHAGDRATPEEAPPRTREQAVAPVSAVPSAPRSRPVT
ncbi:oxidoreductase [Sorangium cellulosum]|uniref:Oxidoreductase n=1 Tax=Sorangium cellulosum TaxID=56 RepID=A0A4V0ND95_SORCE|nr:FAD-dependent oxidoreductase [Sorangium cellulosum]AUX21892.1 oxidoreductase [Sorangium cellulosum]